MGLPKIVDVGIAAEDVVVPGPGHFIKIRNVQGAGHVGVSATTAAATLADAAVEYGLGAGDSPLIIPRSIGAGSSVTLSMIASVATKVSVCAVERPDLDG
jgi:hypothetical protein